MILYHIDKQKYQTVWPPEGTLYSEGRWNQPGQWVIYTSPSIALAKLEILANETNLPIKRVCMIMDVPDGAEIFDVDVSRLPKNWMAKPYPPGLHHLTSKFLQSSALLMKVPSALSPREHNFLLNVRHPRFQSVQLTEVFPEPFDPRLK